MDKDLLELQDDERALVKKTLHIFAELCDIMPSIGFLNRSKRLAAYIAVTNKAQRLIDAEHISEGEMLFVLSVLVRKNKDFQKAAMMAGLSLAKLETHLLTAVGFKYANDIRVNMRLSPVADKSTMQA